MVAVTGRGTDGQTDRQKAVTGWVRCLQSLCLPKRKIEDVAPREKLTVRNSFR
jgi:hypothetical protein